MMMKKKIMLLALIIWAIGVNGQLEWSDVDYIGTYDSEVCPEGWHIPSMDEWKILMNQFAVENEYGMKQYPNSADSLLELGFSVGTYTSSTRAGNSGPYIYNVPSTGKVVMNIGYPNTEYKIRCVREELELPVMPVRDMMMDNSYIEAVPETINVYDERDGKNYTAKLFANNYWMLQDLEYHNGNIDVPAEEGGNYYGIGEFRHVCPVGWSVPTRLDYLDLAQVIPNVEADTKGNRVVREWVQDNLNIEVTGYRTIRSNGVSIWYEPTFPLFSHPVIGTLGKAEYWLDEEDLNFINSIDFDFGPASNLNGFTASQWGLSSKLLVLGDTSNSEYDNSAYVNYFKVRCIKNHTPVVIDSLYLSQGVNFIKLNKTIPVSVFDDYPQILLISDMSNGNSVMPYYNLYMFYSLEEGKLYKIRTNDAIKVDVSN